MVRVVCTERRCGWYGDSSEVLRAPNPFEPEYEIEGCPKCKEVDTVVRACDEPNCHRPATCGSPTPYGYRNTCGEHLPYKALRGGE